MRVPGNFATASLEFRIHESLIYQITRTDKNPFFTLPPRKKPRYTSDTPEQKKKEKKNLWFARYKNRTAPTDTVKRTRAGFSAEIAIGRAGPN